MLGLVKYCAFLSDSGQNSFRKSSPQSAVSLIVLVLVSLQTTGTLMLPISPSLGASFVRASKLNSRKLDMSRG